MHELNVPAGGQNYTVKIGLGLLPAIGQMVREVAPDHRAGLILDTSVAQTHAPPVLMSLHEAGYAVTPIEIEADEREKSLGVVRGIYSVLLSAGLERRSPIVAVGGGITGDLAGFVAATYLRGVPLIHVPTTLLAMVDASIGGKTGVNIELPQGEDRLGKNLVGSFWPPRLVVSDLSTLGTLPPREIRCGLAECIKHAMLSGSADLDWLEARLEAILAGDAAVMMELVQRSAALKIRIVSSDEHEAGERALLNLGHTFGHAVESLPRLDLRHGEAVAIGLCAVMHLAESRGHLDKETRERITTLIDRAGLPTRLPQRVHIADLMQAMGHDKKAALGRIRLVVPWAPGDVRIMESVPRDEIEHAWRAVGAVSAATDAGQLDDPGSVTETSGKNP